MSTHSKLKDLQQAWNNDLPQDSLRLFREISQEYIEKRQYRELGELLMLANERGYYIKRMVEPAIYEAFDAVFTQLKNINDDALTAVFMLLLYRIDRYSNADEYWQQISDETIWTTDCRKYDWAIEENEVMSEVFHHELMAAIGLEMEQYERLYEHYKQTDNRTAQAYLLVKMQTNHYGICENTDMLEQVMADYGDLQVACEAAISYYKNHKWHEDTEEQDKLTAMNEAATAQYEFLNRALVRWGKWHKANILKEYLKQLCSTEVTNNNTDFNQLWYNNEQKRVGVRYRNAKILTLTVYQTALTGWDETDHDKLKKIAKQSKQVLEIKHKSENNADYLYETHEFVLDELPIGVYILCLAINGKEQLYFRQQVTNLILTTNQLHGDKTRVAVLQADSGMPAENAAVRWEHRYGYKRKLQKGELRCDENGEVTVLCSNPDFFAFTPTDQAAKRDSIYSWGSWSQNSDDVQTNILTDRSIYRPGQTMHIAVVCYSMAADKRMQTLRKTIHLNIINAKWDTLLEKTLKTDDYGVAHLDFTIPEDCPTGQLQIKDFFGGYKHTVRVEQYKRPTFEVMLNPYGSAYKAEETIEVTGKAMSYAGVAIAGGKVKYRVLRRRAHWWWFYSHYWGFEGDAYERRGETISEAETQTDDDGTFICRVPLEMPEENDEYGYYDFVLTADVVDTTGETHSAEQVLPLSTKDYFFACSVPEQQEIHETAVCHTVLTNALGEPLIEQVKMQIDEQKPIAVSANDDIALPTLTTGEHTIRLTYKEETIERTIFIVDKTATFPPIQTNDWKYCSAERFTADEPLYIQVGASSGKTYLLYTILSDRKIIESGHVLAENGMLNKVLYYNEDYHFGIRVCFAWVRDHEFHHAEFTILPPEEKRDLQLQWETFRNRVEPGTDEIWRLRVTENGMPADANIIATMYDKSLEQLMPHSWDDFAPRISWEVPSTLWRTHDISGQNIYFDSYERHSEKHGLPEGVLYSRRLSSVEYELSDSVCYDAAPCGAPPAGSADFGEEEVAPMPAPRTNFAETAFFMPQLRTDAEGGVYLEFHLPDTLTTWLVKAVAHTKQMHYGFLTEEVIAQRPVMLQPNLPRFLRAGDHATLTAKISNLTDNDLQGKVRLELKDARTDTVIHTETKAISLSANAVESVSFEVQVGEEYHELTCTMAVIGKDFSDGEQHSMPILGSTEEVMTALSFSQLKAGKHTVQVADILPTTVADKWLSVDYTTNPFWIAYEALPKIVDREAENAISVAVSLYCNHLAYYIQHIVRPNIIDNDKYFLDKELIEKLSALQKQDGGFAWYKSMYSSDFLTAEVMMHLARLTKMTAPIETLQPIIGKANQYLDRMIEAEVREQQKLEKKGYKPYFPSYATLQHLYSCALLGRELQGDTKAAYQYLVGLLKGDIHSQTIREKAMTALILEYNGEHERAMIYAESLRQYTTCEELKGRWFKTDRASYSWMSYKIPTHTLSMEVLFALQPDDKQTISEMQVWLLQEKRTQIWDTPLDCVNAVHALLLCGREDMLRKHDAQDIQIYADNALVELPAETNSPTLHADISADTQTVLFDKHFDGLSWGTVSAEFRQPLSEISQHANGMTLHREIIGDIENLHVGDRLRVRLTVQCDRNYDMVEIRDVRAACMEPVNQLTRSDSFVHIAPHDTETVYSYLGMSEGTHTIETEYYLTQVGVYQLGLATVRCCYAPEFGATCPSETIVVKK